jgi:hypothetical protein
MHPVKPMRKLAIPDHAQRGHLMTQFPGWPAGSHGGLEAPARLFAARSLFQAAFPDYAWGRIQGRHFLNHAV